MSKNVYCPDEGDWSGYYDSVYYDLDLETDSPEGHLKLEEEHTLCLGDEAEFFGVKGRISYRFGTWGFETDGAYIPWEKVDEECIRQHEKAGYTCYGAKAFREDCFISFIEILENLNDFWPINETDAIPFIVKKGKKEKKEEKE